MNKLTQTGRFIFAIGIMALGIVCFISRDFIIGRPHAWPAGFQLNPALAYVSGGLLILSAFAIFIEKKTLMASLIIAILIFMLSVIRDIPYLTTEWLNACKAIAFLGGALIMASSFLKEGNRFAIEANINQSMVKVLMITGVIMLAIFFVAGGYAHFKFADFVTNFIPEYIPLHKFWAYFCGVCLIAGGVGIIIPRTRKRAAILSGLMLSGWFVLLHIPRFLANTKDASDRLGLCESFTFAGIFFVLAGLVDDKRDTRW